MSYGYLILFGLTIIIYKNKKDLYQKFKENILIRIVVYLIGEHYLASNVVLLSDEAYLLQDNFYNIIDFYITRKIL